MKKIIQFSGLLIISLLSGFCNLYAQKPAIIKGHIIDSRTQSSMMYVNIVEIDKNGRFVSGTVSDINGNYVFKVSNDKNPLQASFIGYIKQSIQINGRSKVDIQLDPDDKSLGEVRIEGTKLGNDGYTKVRDRATSVARIDFKDMKSLMTTTVEDMLQGRFGNVDISSMSGDPGAGLNIRIRGTATLNARNSPLIVINGIPYDATIDPDFDFGSADVEKFGNLIDVSPEDIESIEVLKDAASTAAWGSKASNGVLMIKTKRGIKSKPIFEYTFKNTTGWEPAPIPMLDGAGYARLITEEQYNWQRNDFATNPLYAKDYQQIAYDPEWDQYYNYSQNTNWVKEITHVSNTKQHDFSVRGGGDKTKYNMSVGFFDEGGTTIGNELKKLNLRSSLDYDLSSKLQFKSDIMFTRYDQNNTYDAEDNAFWPGNLVRSVAYRRMPNLSVYNRDTLNIFTPGDYFIPTSTLQGNAGTGNYNPVAFANLGVNHQLKDNTRALFTTRYSIMPNLIWNATVTLDIFDNKREKFLPYEAIGYNYADGISNRATNEFTKKSTIYTVNQVIYNPKTGPNHDLSFQGQFDTEETTERWFKTETSQSASPDMQQPVGDKHLNTFGSSISQYRSMGFFGSASYKYMDKYIFMVGAKYEGNSKFAPESRWGLFPTVSGAWRINKENFLKDVKWINDLKLRASWGESGNAPDQNYLYWNSYNAGSGLSYMDMQGVEPGGLEKTSLKWETIRQINPGLSFLALDNRLNIEIDYYKKTTLDLYLKDSGIPTSTGFGSLSRNNGSLENRGAEFTMDYTIVRKKDWSLNFNLNLSTNKNVVLALPDNYSTEYGDMLTNGQYKISIQPGQSMGGFFGYRYLGTYTTSDDAVVRDVKGNPIYGLNKDVPLRMTMGGTSGYVFEGGDARYDDINHDGKIDELDLVYLGDLNPKFMGGTGFRVQYKGFILNTFFYAKVGQKIINQTRMDTEKMYGYDNQSTATNWRWRRDGDITDMPRALYNRGYNWLGSDRFVEDGSYIRLKSLSLSYLFDPKVCRTLRVKDLKVYCTAYNLYTWTKYSGQDPDVSQPNKPDTLPKDESRTPPSQKFMIGVNVTF